MSYFGDNDLTPLLPVDLQDKKKDKEKSSTEEISGPSSFGAGIGELCVCVCVCVGGWVGGGAWLLYGPLYICT